MGCLKRQALTRSMIEPIHNIMMYLCVRQRVEGHAFRYILANQAISVFVESPLPGMIGMRKIYGRLHRLANPDMMGKLFAVVRRNGLGMRFMGLKQPNGGLGNCLSLFGSYFVQQGIARAPFNQRDEGAGALTSHDQIDFPIADGRALVNADPVFPRASALP